MTASTVKAPDDYKNAADYLAACRKEMALDLEADKDNREAGLDDAKFAVGEQWPDRVRRKRERANKPVLTFNRLIAFASVVLGSRRLNETVIKVLPDNGGTKEVACVREDLLRSIQKNSRASLAYDKAMENQIFSSIGNFQVTLEYASDDVFEQDIRISQIANPFAVVWDRMSIEADGRDADHCWVIDMVDQEVAKKRWPKAQFADMVMDTAVLGELARDGWAQTGTVRVVAHWRMRSRKRTLALLKNGNVSDITDKKLTDAVAGPPDPQTGAPTQTTLADQIVQRADGTPVMRDADRHYAQMYLINGVDILEGPYELPIDSLPVFRVPGWEVNVGEKRHRWSLMRFLKDPQRLHNYWRSVIAEKLMKSPQAQWVASKEAVQGREDEWRNSHLSDDNLLVYNGEAGNPPQRTPPAQIEPALIQEAGSTSQDLKDISNIHEAGLGQQSNEVSGKAIVARQRVGELGTVIYNDYMNLAIERCGQVCNQLIPIAYDTPRVIKAVGPDDRAYLQKINYANDPESVDITSGKYAVSLTTGPSYTTKRIEAAESMLNLINAMPQVMSVAADKIVEAQDWPGSEEISRRLKNQLPPGTVPPDEMTPEQQQAAQGAQAAQAHAAQVQQIAAQLEMEGKQAETDEKKARARQAMALALKAEAEARVIPLRAATDASSTVLHDHLDTIETAHGGSQPDVQDPLDDQLKRANLRKANAQADEAEIRARTAAQQNPATLPGDE